MSTTTIEDARSLDEMIPTLYDELLRLAEIYLRNERSDHTLQRTALVHEAFLRLESQRTASWENRAHFLGRRVLLHLPGRHTGRLPVSH